MANADSKHGMRLGDKVVIDKYRQGFQLLGEKQDSVKCWRQGGRKGKVGKVPAGKREAFLALAVHFLDWVFAKPSFYSPALLSQGL